jgi:hypothetical protein
MEDLITRNVMTENLPSAVVIFKDGSNGRGKDEILGVF